MPYPTESLRTTPHLSKVTRSPPRRLQLKSSTPRRSTPSSRNFLSADPMNLDVFSRWWSQTKLPKTFGLRKTTHSSGFMLFQGGVCSIRNPGLLPNVMSKNGSLALSVWLEALQRSVVRLIIHCRASMTLGRATQRRRIPLFGLVAQFSPE